MAKEKKVELEDYASMLVPVYTTEKNPYYEKNLKVMVHPDMVAHLTSNGMMSSEKPEGYEEPEEE